MANSAALTSRPYVDPTIFSSLQAKRDKDTAIRDSLQNIVETLSKQGRERDAVNPPSQSILSRIHNTPTANLEASVLAPYFESLKEQAVTVKDLAYVASKYPFYKWN
ncbi:hypothetical protein CLAIMM_14715 [Cladophialophora immunda]|nr:hypothetical protein CLAIMM_14715 [Cladophialophora immunda]